MTSTPFDNKLHVLILQHPQEPDKELGTAKLLIAGLKNATLKIGLSWPNLTKALGAEAKPSEWIVLYLGSQKEALDSLAEPGLHVLKPKDATLKKILPEIKGIIVLDGTWSQAKTMWWRNAWLLKCKRGYLIPKQKSAYGNLRKEPRKECVSTLEAVAETLTLCGEEPVLEATLRKSFVDMIELIKRPNGR